MGFAPARTFDSVTVRLPTAMSAMPSFRPGSSLSRLAAKTTARAGVNRSKAHGPLPKAWRRRVYTSTLSSLRKMSLSGNLSAASSTNGSTIGTRINTNVPLPTGTDCIRLAAS